MPDMRVHKKLLPSFFNESLYNDVMGVDYKIILKDNKTELITQNAGLIPGV